MAKKLSVKVERKRVSVDELRQFIKVFQAATSISEVVEKMGWKLEKVRTQATRLRKRGVALKKFPRGSGLSDADFAALAKLADSK
jgi:hypothetical protein